MNAPVRGQVYSVDAKPWVVVSNNLRNKQLDDVLAAPIAATAKIELPTMVRLDAADPVAGFVLADEVEQLFRDELTTPLGLLSPGTIMKLNQALKIVLALP